MKALEKQEKTRLLLSVVLGLAIHIGLFLILEFGEFIKLEDKAEFVGPMIVELSEYTTVPDTRQAVESTAEVVEEALIEEPEAEAAEPEVSTEEPVEPPTDKPVQEQEPPVKTPQDMPVQPQEDSDQERVPSTPVEDYTIPTPPEQERNEQPELWNGVDEGNEMRIRMGSLAVSPQPNIGPSIALELPAWISTIGRKLEIRFSFVVGPDGFITNLNLEQSSGYPEVDRAIRDTLRQWKFSRPIRRERVEGEFTYIIKS